MYSGLDQYQPQRKEKIATSTRGYLLWEMIGKFDQNSKQPQILYRLSRPTHEISNHYPTRPGCLIR